ncbi:MAG: hypothetical protein OXU20_36475 [Myxococcales bacterium]|nr:hypothetical protein [Myxococcales bacterium]
MSSAPRLVLVAVEGHAEANGSTGTPNAWESALAGVDLFVDVTGVDVVGDRVVVGCRTSC